MTAAEFLSNILASPALRPAQGEPVSRLDAFLRLTSRALDAEGHELACSAASLAREFGWSRPAAQRFIKGLCDEGAVVVRQADQHGSVLSWKPSVMSVFRPTVAAMAAIPDASPARPVRKPVAASLDLFGDEPPAEPKISPKRQFLADRDAAHEREYKDQFAPHYPAPTDSKSGREAFKRMRRTGVTVEDLVAAARGYAAQCDEKRTDEKYRRGPASFLEKYFWREFVGKAAPVARNETEAADIRAANAVRVRVDVALEKLNRAKRFSDAKALIAAHKSGDLANVRMLCAEAGVELAA
jgi:hypothetical protein